MALDDWEGVRMKAQRTAGFTMIELVAVMAVMGVLAAIGMLAFASRYHASAHRGSAEELISQLRSVAQRSISEGRTFCVVFDDDARSAEIWQQGCTSAVGGAPVGTYRTKHRDVTLSIGSPPDSEASVDCPTSTHCLYFRPRGTATPADITVVSKERPSSLYTVHVERLTARVWM